MSMRKIYRKIAKKHGVSVSKVRDDMQCAIDKAYGSAPDDGVTKAYQSKVARSGEIPTPEEFILHMAKDLKDKK